MLISLLACIHGCLSGTALAGTQAGPVRVSPGAGTTYRVPYRLTETKHILVRAKVNGHGPFNFIMDTGAPDLFLAIENARKAGCTIGKDGYAEIRTFEIEGGPIEKSVEARAEEIFQLRSMNAIDAAGARIDGVMGYTMLARFRIELDLNQSQMRWTRLAYVPPRPPAMAELTGGKPLQASKDAKNMEQLAGWASTMFQRKPSPPPIARGFLGIEFQPGDALLRVDRLFPNGPAQRAGVKPGDRIESVEVPPHDPVSTGTVDDLHKATAELRPGQPVILAIERGGAKLRLRVTAEGGTL